MTTTFTEAVVVLEREATLGKAWRGIRSIFGKLGPARHFIRKEIVPSIDTVKDAVRNFETMAKEVSTDTSGRELATHIRTLIDKADLQELKDDVTIFRDKWLRHSQIEKSAFPLEAEINKRLNILMGGFKKAWDIANETGGVAGQLEADEVMAIKKIYPILRKNATALGELFLQLSRGD